MLVERIGMKYDYANDYRGNQKPLRNRFFFLQTNKIYLFAAIPWMSVERKILVNWMKSETSGHKELLFFFVLESLSSFYFVFYHRLSTRFDFSSCTKARGTFEVRHALFYESQSLIRNIWNRHVQSTYVSLLDIFSMNCTFIELQRTMRCCCCKKPFLRLFFHHHRKSFSFAILIITKHKRYLDVYVIYIYIWIFFNIYKLS